MLDRDTCLDAMSRRDAAFDGRFFIGVRTTGIYCRPVCKARIPRPENVTFYPSAARQDCGRPDRDKPFDFSLHGTLLRQHLLGKLFALEVTTLGVRCGRTIRRNPLRSQNNPECPTGTRRPTRA
jgi:hypothetical protein